jgi:hypothetical protein
VISSGIARLNKCQTFSSLLAELEDVLKNVFPAISPPNIMLIDEQLKVLFKEETRKLAEFKAMNIENGTQEMYVEDLKYQVLKSLRNPSR